MLEHKISLDVRPIVSKIHDEWDGEESKTFPRFLQRKKNKDRITNALDACIPCRFGTTSYKFDLKDGTVCLFLNAEKVEKKDVRFLLDQFVKMNVFGYQIY